MLTEQEARDLLARAATTIEVAPAEPAAIPTRSTRWLVPLVAAAAAITVIVTTAILVRDDPAAVRPAVTPPTQTHTPRAHGLMPSVFSYDATSAKAMLRAHGLVVTTKPKYTCDTPGRAVRTLPSTGSHFMAGDHVTLFVTESPPNADCRSPFFQETLAWRVLDFANGRGPAPAFAARVTTYVNGKRTTLSGAKARSLEAWGPTSALGLLAAASQQQFPDDPQLTPSLLVDGRDGRQPFCSLEVLPNEVAGRYSAGFAIVVPAPWPGPCLGVNVFQTNDRIDAIVVRGSWGLNSTDGERIAAQFLAYARGKSNQLPIDTPVRLYLGNEYRKTIDAPDTADRSSWEICAAYAERACPMSAVTELRDSVSDPTFEDSLPPSVCLNRLADPPTDTGGSQVVVLRASGISSCIDDFAVQIWYNDLDQITAVNLLMGSP